MRKVEEHFPCQSHMPFMGEHGGLGEGGKGAKEVKQGIHPLTCEGGNGENGMLRQHG